MIKVFPNLFMQVALPLEAESDGRPPFNLLQAKTTTLGLVPTGSTSRPGPPPALTVEHHSGFSFLGYSKDYRPRADRSRIFISRGELSVE